MDLILIDAVYSSIFLKKGNLVPLQKLAKYDEILDYIKP